ncbi:MAG: hypothetical protein IJV11_03585 [Muribaculaceae bacterium]|nr:hypothetical protein [Muribaculaceae bacterium]
MDDNFDDYFIENQEPEEEKLPHQETEQEREEREIKEATIERRGSTFKILLTLIIAAMVLFLGWWVWQYYFSPYRVSQEKGWVMRVSYEGTVFKTFEGEMITEGYIEDTLVAMHSNFFFSIPNDSTLVREAMSYAADGQRVILTYNEYKGRVLWRGDTKHVVVKIERDSNFVKSNPYKEQQLQQQEKKK